VTARLVQAAARAQPASAHACTYIHTYCHQCSNIYFSCICGYRLDLICILWIFVLSFDQDLECCLTYAVLCPAVVLCCAVLCCAACRLGLGIEGAAWAMTCCTATNALLLTCYQIYRDKFLLVGRPERTWRGYSRAAFRGWWQYLSLGVPAAAMICLVSRGDKYSCL
jgi:hypothetical protein